MRIMWGVMMRSSRLDIDLRDKVLLGDFREFVKEFHNGKFKQFYRLEINNALKFYLAANDYKNYRDLLENENDVRSIIIPGAMCAPPKPVFDQKMVYFVTQFFKKYYGTEKVKTENLTKFIKKTLLISEKRSIQNKKQFLCDIGWVKAWATGGWEIRLKKDSLFKLIGEDPTGVYDPNEKYRNEVESIFNAKLATEESKATIRRF